MDMMIMIMEIIKSHRRADVRQRRNAELVHIEYPAWSNFQTPLIYIQAHYGQKLKTITVQPYLYNAPLET